MTMSTPAAPTGTLHTEKLSGCLFRVQELRIIGGKKQTALESRITQLVWNTTPEQVTHTVNNMYGSGSNAMLWLNGTTGLAYCGLGDYIGIHPQAGLDSDENSVTIILPSGNAKLQSISGNLGEIPAGNQQQMVYFKGIKGTLEANDLAWTTMKQMKVAIDKQYLFRKEAAKYRYDRRELDVDCFQ